MFQSTIRIEISKDPCLIKLFFFHILLTRDTVCTGTQVCHQYYSSFLGLSHIIVAVQMRDFGDLLHLCCSNRYISIKHVCINDELPPADPLILTLIAQDTVRTINIGCI
jgi:hypothetical protein